MGLTTMLESWATIEASRTHSTTARVVANAAVGLAASRRRAADGAAAATLGQWRAALTTWTMTATATTTMGGAVASKGSTPIAAVASSCYQATRVTTSMSRPTETTATTVGSSIPSLAAHHALGAGATPWCALTASPTSLWRAMSSITRRPTWVQAMVQ